MKIINSERQKILDNVEILHRFTDRHYSDEEVVQKFITTRQHIKNPSYIFTSDSQFWANETFNINKDIKPLFNEYKNNTFVVPNIFFLSMLYLNYKLEVMLQRSEKKSKSKKKTSKDVVDVDETS